MADDGQSPTWVTRDLSAVRTRREALLRVVEASLPVCVAADGTPVPPVLQNAASIEVVPKRKLRLWHFTWLLPSGARFEDTPEQEAAQLDGFLLVGPSALARLGIESLPGVEPKEEGWRFRGDGHALRSLLPPGEEEHSARLLAALQSAARPAGTLRLGADLPWKRTAGNELDERYGYVGRLVAKIESWRPEMLRNEARYEERKDVYEPLIAASSKGDVGREAELAYEASNKEMPWRTLFDHESRSAEAEAFFACASRDVIGFAPPQPGEAVLVRAQRLPFYRGGHLVDVVDRRGGYPRLSRFVAYADETAEQGAPRFVRTTPVDWIANTMHLTNQQENLQLTAGTVRPYLKYFCQCVQASEGYFRIVESPDDLRWLGLTKTIREQAAPFIEPVKLWTPEPVVLPDGQSVFLLSAAVVYSRMLFVSVFIVSANGPVDMPDDFPVVHRLPIIPESVSSKTHFVYLARMEQDA